MCVLVHGGQRAISNVGPLMPSILLRQGLTGLHFTVEVTNWPCSSRDVPGLVSASHFSTAGITITIAGITGNQIQVPTLARQATE